MPKNISVLIETMSSKLQTNLYELNKKAEKWCILVSYAGLRRAPIVASITDRKTFSDILKLLHKNICWFFETINLKMPFFIYVTASQYRVCF